MLPIAPRMDQVISVPGIVADIAPYAFQFWAKDFYAAYRATS